MTEFRDRVADTCAEVLFEIELYHKSGGDTGPIDRIADSVNALWASFSRDEMDAALKRVNVEALRTR